jgi:hypothetical protein
MAEFQQGDMVALTSLNSDNSTPPAPAFTHPAVVVFADNGDLRLCMTYESGLRTIEFIVSSSSLARASPIFRFFLFGRDPPSRPSQGEWVVSLPDCDPEAMLVLLYIAHLRFDMVPDRPNLERLYWILCASNTYDMTKTLRPWASGWLKVAREAQAFKNPVMTIFVAMELGDEKLVRTMFIELLKNCSINRDGLLTTSDGLCCRNYQYGGPVGLLGMSNHSIFKQSSNTTADQVCYIRTIITQCILNLLHGTSRKLANGSHCEQRTVSPENRTRCNYAIFGGLCKETFEARGTVLPESAFGITESLSDFYSSMKKAVDAIVCIPGHDGCSPAQYFDKILHKVMLVPEDHLVSRTMRRYMKEQRRRSGIAEPTRRRDRVRNRGVRNRGVRNGET